MGAVELGLGLLSIGRRWGANNVPPPDHLTARRLIRAAALHGIRFFDTAPAYGASERILGAALREEPELFADCTIATKVGEHWSEHTEHPWTSHAFEDLNRSLDKSMLLLGRIDILQVHKACAENITSDPMLLLFEKARALGINQFGASVSDLDTAKLACNCGHYQFLQFPFNLESTGMRPAFELLATHGMRPIVNRPLAMGALVRAESSVLSSQNAFQFVRGCVRGDGVILTGTSRLDHLLQNIEAYTTASP